jgi:hypothetical protein
MNSPLMINVAGVRGIVDDSLTPPVLSNRFRNPPEDTVYLGEAEPGPCRATGAGRFGRDHRPGRRRQTGARQFLE